MPPRWSRRSAPPGRSPACLDATCGCSHWRASSSLSRSCFCRSFSSFPHSCSRGCGSSCSFCREPWSCSRRRAEPGSPGGPISAASSRASCSARCWSARSGITGCTRPTRGSSDSLRRDADGTSNTPEGIMSIGDLFWLFFIFSALQPVLRQRMQDAMRARKIAQLETLRKSRVILLVHRQETMKLLGFPLMRYIDVNDSEDVLRAIHMTDDELPLDIVHHTPGGLVLAATQIARAIREHKGKVT